jgi:hypothetical protein
MGAVERPDGNYNENARAQILTKVAQYSRFCFKGELESPYQTGSQSMSAVVR